MESARVRKIFSNELAIALIPAAIFLLASYIDAVVNLFSGATEASLTVFMVRHVLFSLVVLQAVACGYGFKNITKPYFHFMIFVLLTGALLFVCALIIDDFVTRSIDVNFLQ